MYNNRLIPKEVYIQTKVLGIVGMVQILVIKQVSQALCVHDDL